jgi:hypothetical protein
MATCPTTFGDVPINELIGKTAQWWSILWILMGGNGRFVAA